MNVNEVYDLAKSTVYKSNELKNKYTDEINAVVSYACIFCKNDDDYNTYIDTLKNSGDEIIENTYSGPIFRIKDLDTVSGTLKLLKIRRHDDEHLDFGDTDFKVADYESFKNRYVNNQGFKLISREGYEMIELMEDGCDVRVYFSNPPLDEELGIE